jgi:hypothetical protein
MTAEVKIKTTSESDDAQRDLKKLEGSLDSLSDSGKKSGLSLTDLKSGIDMAGMAIQKIGEAYAATIGKTVAYAEQVRDLGRLSGASAEETSRLIQTADDLKVEYGVLTQAAKALAKDGIALTTEELAKASDEYLAIEDAGGRAEYAVKKFGRAGLELTKVLEAGGDALRGMAKGQSENLVLTEKQLQETRELEIAQDNLEDSIAGLTYAFSNKLIPTIVDAIKATTTLINWDNDLLNVLKLHQKDVRVTAKSYAEYAEEMTRAARAAGYNVSATGEVTKAVTSVGGAIGGVNIGLNIMTEYYKDLAETGFIAAGSQKAVATETKNVAGSITDLYNSLGPQANAWEEAEAAMKSYNETLRLTSSQVEGLLTKYGSLTQAMIFNTLAAGMDEKAAMQLGISMGLIAPQTVAARDAIDSMARSNNAAAKETDYYKQQAIELAAAIANLKDKDVKVTTYFNNVYNNPQNVNGPGQSGPAPMTESQLQAQERAEREARIAEARRQAEIERLK